jgi:hypothetical protein
MRVARFNMPFELGLSVAVHQQTGKHEWRVFETKPYRLETVPLGHVTLSGKLPGIPPSTRGVAVV